MNKLNTKARLIAHYLPQFHPIAENDKWWGKGFTEWRNVANAKPLFPGHYQPRIPSELGFYDLRVPDTRIQQAELAATHGIEGFIYWHYWFGGKRLLERPFNEVLSSGEPNFPFCIAWANEGWSSIWVGSNKVNQPQEYFGMQEHEKHFFCLLSAFSDDRYIKVEGKPLFFVYQPKNIPDVKKVTEFWRNLAIKAGLKGLYLVGYAWYDTWGRFDPHKWGFDATTFGHQSTAKAMLPKSKIKKAYRILRGLPLNCWTYEEALPYLLSINERPSEHPTIIPGWDNSPRYGLNAGMILHQSTPELWRRHIKDALDKVKDQPYEKRIIFVKSWNEWAESNYLEPDLKYGREYLKVLKDEILFEKKKEDEAIILKGELTMKSIHQKQFEKIEKNLVNKIIFQFENLTTPDLHNIETNDDLYTIALFVRSPDFIKTLCSRYEIDENLLEMIIERELKCWSVSIKKENMVANVLTLRERLEQRLSVWKKNKQALIKILEFVNTPHESFFDVGCALGLGMVSAAEIGFLVVDGIEIKTGFKEFADELKIYVKNNYNADFNYSLGDFNNADFNGKKYDIVYCIDVLEHTKNISKTLSKMNDICNNKGAIYIYQGNSRAFGMVQNEPHYRLPGISILPIELSIKILNKLGKLKSGNEYIIDNWPTLETIKNFASKNNLYFKLIGGEKNIRNGIEYPSITHTAKLIKNCKHSLQNRLFQKIGKDLANEVKYYFNKYLEEVDGDRMSMDEEKFKAEYLYSSWNIVLEKY